MDRQHANALLVLSDTFMTLHRTLLVQTCSETSIASSIRTRSIHPAAGGLISYGPSLPELYRGAAIYVDKILRGEKPANLPVQQPVKIDLIINLKTAKALDLTIPPGLITEADEVIE
jgi:putative ABC transport system substrate-binding protein